MPWGSCLTFGSELSHVLWAQMALQHWSCDNTSQALSH